MLKNSISPKQKKMEHCMLGFVVFMDHTYMLNMRAPMDLIVELWATFGPRPMPASMGKVFQSKKQ